MCEYESFQDEVYAESVHDWLDERPEPDLPTPEEVEPEPIGTCCKCGGPVHDPFDANCEHHR